MVRYLLSNVGYERFSEVDWRTVRDEDFHGACAYCGQAGTVTLDHAVAINRIHLGEHRLGNLVPACSRCNEAKSNKDFRHFLSTKFEDDPVYASTRIGLIEAHASKLNYRPIGTNDDVTALIEEARAKLKEVADHYLALINSRVNGP
nr:HNH endonuclease [Aeromicrobium wangtongii]